MSTKTMLQVHQQDVRLSAKITSELGDQFYFFQLKKKVDRPVVKGYLWAETFFENLVTGSIKLLVKVGVGK